MAINSVEEIQDIFKPEGQSFQIDPSNQAFLLGKEGTAIYIPPDAFVLADGTSPVGEVTIELAECYTWSSMIANNLSTTSQGRLLETGGMINLTATLNGTELKIRDGLALGIGMPNVTEEGMGTYYGQDDGNGNIEWASDYELALQGDGQIDDPVKSPNYSVISGDTITTSTSQTGWPYNDERYYSDVTYLSATGGSIGFPPLKGTDVTLHDFILQNQILTDDELERLSVVNYAGVQFEIDDQGRRWNYEPLNTAAGATVDQKILDLIKDMPEFDLTNTGWSIYDNGPFEIWIGVTSRFDESLFKEEFEFKYAEYKDATIEKINQNDLDLFVITTAQLGWINCDRFLNTNEELINYAVRVEDPENTRVQIIFDDINCIMQGQLSGGEFVFPNMPVGFDIRVLAIGYAGGKPLMATGATKINTEGYTPVEYQEFTLAQLEEQINAV